eukprot:CAMPEP_0172590110 /NCGR_PEP_ID=MMETSP1068-20121228/8563_1 /TAXON_ID=35684 /ORGANISM="Pseudopedinella elastica, Strain CCMP716" /LENGTH=114 /DNA_ID=CAMNT_0013385805 /DNA_START=72 /DNA_END=417 /DNA_ORIENTATION=+
MSPLGAAENTKCEIAFDGLSTITNPAQPASKANVFRPPASAEASKQAARPSKVDGLPASTDFWQTLKLFIESANLPPKSAAALEEHFRQAHHQRLATLSLDDLEDIISSRDASL